MRNRMIVRTALACALVLSPLGTTVATANHTSAHTQVIFYHPYPTFVGDFHFGNADCTGTTCTVNVALSGSDRSKFNRFCGRDFSITIPAGQPSVINHYCDGANGWRIGVDVWLLEDVHSAPVTVFVVPVRP